MKPPKPRVTIEPDSTFAEVSWEPVPQATYYTVSYSLEGSSVAVNTLRVTSTAVTITSLQPDTSYTTYVTATIITHHSHPTIINFRTIQSQVCTTLGSGDSFFPKDLTNLSSNTYGLQRTDAGYRFNPNGPAMFYDDRSFQFCTFYVGDTRNNTHLDLQLVGASGPWKTSEDKAMFFDDTILQVLVKDRTGWLDANRLRIPGIPDRENGARAFDGMVDGTWQSFRVTLSCLSPFFSVRSEVYVRVGITDDGRGICGVKLFS